MENFKQTTVERKIWRILIYLSPTSEIINTFAHLFYLSPPRFLNRIFESVSQASFHFTYEYSLKTVKF